jgi:hypothetical protein
MRTSETNAFATSTTKKQKCTCSPTKSPMKKTKQKYYNVTPLEEDETWKTVLGKAYRKTKKVLNGNDSDDEWPTDANFFPSDDELDNSDNEVKFIKKMKVQPETVLSSSDEEDDAEVKIVGVKKAKENYYENLAPTTNEEKMNLKMTKKTKMIHIPQPSLATRTPALISPPMKRNPKMKTPRPKNPLLKRNPLPLITNPPPTPPLTVTRKKKRKKKQQEQSWIQIQLKIKKMQQNQALHQDQQPRTRKGKPYQLD